MKMLRPLSAQTITALAKPSLTFCLLISLIGTACAQTNTNTQPNIPFWNPNLPISTRVDDLVSRMTLEEKAGQMMNGAPAIPKLGLPAYEWWSEGLHGLWTTKSTTYPMPIGLAASFDLSLETNVAHAISDEARAWNNWANKGQVDSEHAHGLTYFAPNINIFRDPRWGRGPETFGEDPYLTAQFGVTYVKEMQGYDPKYLKLISTPKHFAVHSGPESERHGFNANPSLYDLNDTYLPAFEATVRDGHAESVMTAYSALYGVPDSANPILVKQKLRGDWGFKGYVISDFGAVKDIFSGDGNKGHFYVKSMAQAAAAAVNNGCDMTFYHEYDALPEAVKEGLVSEDQVNVSVKRLFTARMKTGMFDPPSMVPYTKISEKVIDDAEHRQLALKAAQESMVLLKNDNGFLPLGTNIHSIALIGPNVDNLCSMGGNYPLQAWAGRPSTSSKFVTPLEALTKRAAAAGIKLEYVKGCNLTDVDQAVPVPIPASALSSEGKPGLKGEYFSNQNLEGLPFLTNQDATIAFNWNDTPPHGLSHDHYSVRWSGAVTAPRDGTYIFALRGDDGFRLFVNNQKILDDWGDHQAETKFVAVPLKAGESVPIKLEYYQNDRGAEISMSWIQVNQTPFSDAITAAKNADAVIFIGGISSIIEGEEGTPMGGDRTTMDLPAVQQQLLEAVATTGKPIACVLMNGSAMSVNWAQTNAAAILESWYPGEEGGQAIADVLFGDYNPAGRLPLTFYTGLNQLPDFHDYSMKNRTYRYFSGTPLYQFGFGLSYTKFAYSDLKAPETIAPGKPVTVQATVKNIGDRAGDEVAELYLRPDPIIASTRVDPRLISPNQPMPQVILTGFKRINLAPGESKTISFTITPKQLLLVNAQGERKLQPGAWEIFVGGSQPALDRDGRAKTPSPVLSSILWVK